MFYFDPDPQKRRHVCGHACALCMRKKISPTIKAYFFLQDFTTLSFHVDQALIAVFDREIVCVEEDEIRENAASSGLSSGFDFQMVGEFEPDAHHHYHTKDSTSSYLLAQRRFL